MHNAMSMGTHGRKGYEFIIINPDYYDRNTVNDQSEIFKNGLIFVVDVDFNGCTCRIIFFDVTFA